MKAMRPRGSAHELERRRYRAIELRSEGKSLSAVARLLSVSRRTVARWLRLHRQGGKQALDAQPVPGRPPRLSPQQEQAALRQLNQWLEQGKPKERWLKQLQELRELQECRSNPFLIDKKMTQAFRKPYQECVQYLKRQRRVAQRLQTILEQLGVHYCRADYMEGVVKRLLKRWGCIAKRGSWCLSDNQEIYVRAKALLDYFDYHG